MQKTIYLPTSVQRRKTVLFLFGVGVAVVGFDWYIILRHLGVAQWLEHLTGVTEVVGSVPAWDSDFFSVVLSPVAMQLAYNSFIFL